MVRWDSASGGSATDTLTARILGGFLEPFALMSKSRLFGEGVGLGTNAGSALMTGAAQFLLAEGEWSRVIMEAGPLLGFSFLAYRVWVAGDMGLRALAAAKRQNLLAWLLAWDACLSLVNEQLSQPTNLGFMVLVSGLCLAAMPAGRSVPMEEPAARARVSCTPDCDSKVSFPNDSCVYSSKPALLFARNCGREPHRRVRTHAEGAGLEVVSHACQFPRQTSMGGAGLVDRAGHSVPGFPSSALWLAAVLAAPVRMFCGKRRAGSSYR